MGFSIDLDEQTSLLVTERAKVLNVDPSSLVQDIVRAQLSRPELKPRTDEEMKPFYQAIERLREISRQANSPALSGEAVSRAGIYADHD